MSENLIQKIRIKDTEYDIVDVNAVKVIPQDLTDEQKAQARENIGVVGTGKDGVSPTLSLSSFSDSTGSGVRVSVENGDGSNASYPVYNGKNGTSAFASVTKTGNVATIITRDATGNKSVDIYDGSDYVLTDADKEEIAEIASELVNVPKPRNNVKNVKDYGATGDGTTDDTEAISTAIADLGDGDTLYFPEGVYRVSNINLKSNMTIQGSGWCSVIQLLDATTDYHGRNNCLNIENVENIIIRDIKLDGTRPTQQSTAASQDSRLNGIHIRHASDVYVENVWMYNNGYHGCIMTYATNVVFTNCKVTDNGFRPIHGHTHIYNCRLSNCVCENNGLGLTGGSGIENDSIFFFGAQYLTINDNIVKSNRRGCITVGCDQKGTAVEDVIPTRNITISGNVCECYADLDYVESENSDTGVAKFSSMGIVVYGGDFVTENVSVTGNTIKNAHEAIYLYAQENNLSSLNAVINDNTIIDCSYGVKATEVADITISDNQFKNLSYCWVYANTCSRMLINGNNVNSPGTSDNMCRLYSCNDIIVRDNNLIGDCAFAFYAPESNVDVVIMDNTMRGFINTDPVFNTNGRTIGNLNMVDGDTNVEPIRLTPYSNAGFVRPTLVNPNTTSAKYRYTTPVEITEADVKYELNTYYSVPNEYTDPSEFDYSPYNFGIVFLSGTELSDAVGIVHPSNSNGTVTFSDNCIEGSSSSIWGIQFTITAEKVKELFPTATHVMMEVQTVSADPDSLGSAHRKLNDGHAYVYRSVVEGDTSVQSDMSQNDPSAPDYIKNRTHWAEDPVVTTETTLEETTYDGFSDGGLQTVANFTLVDGAECVVTWDGVEYTSICKKEHADGVTAFLIGNHALVESGEDNGQPFVIGIIQEYGMLMFMSNNVEATSHTVKIVSTITVQDIHKLDNKYIDAEWMAKKPVAYNAVMSVENTTVVTTQQEGSFHGYFPTDCSSVLSNDIFYVTIDGVEYTSIAIEAGTDIFVVGNVGLLIQGGFYVGDPYMMMISPTAVQIYLASEGDHVVSFRVERPVYEQLPAHYIEDALAAVKQNITGAASTIVETNLILDRALISDSSGKVAASSVTSEELGYLSGVTGNVQDQFNTQTEQTTALAKLAMPGSLKWDGFIGDKEYVVVEDDGYVRMCYVHISDYDPITLSEDVGDTLEGFACVGGLLSWEIEENAIMPFEFTVNEDMSIIAEFFVFAPVDGFALEGIVFPKKGWYLMTQSSMHMGYEIPLMYINGVNIHLVNFPDSNGGGSDKYFESVEEKTYLGDTLTWDGNVDGRVCIEHQFGSGDIVINAKYVKMSDSVLSVTDFVNGFTSLYNNGTQQQKSYEDIINSDMINSDGFISISSIACVPTDNYNILGVTFPEAGIYFGTDGTSYPTYFTIPGYNFVTTEPRTVIKTEHLPKALQFGEITKTEETGGDTLTWDGKTGMVNGDSVMAKFSDRAPTRDDLLKGFTVTIESSNGSETVVVTSENMNNHLSALTGNRMFIFANRSNTVPLVVFTYGDNDFTLEPGIFFYNINGQNYCSSLTINGYTGFPVTTTELVKIDKKYLPDSLQFGEVEKPGVDTLTWDGNIEGRVVVEETNSTQTTKYVKVSDAIPTANDFKNGISWVMNSEGVDNQFNYTYEDMNSFVKFYDDGLIATLFGPCFIPTDNYAQEEIVFPEAGTYFSIIIIPNGQDEDGDGVRTSIIKSITLPGYTGFGATTEIVKIDEKYLPSDTVKNGDNSIVLTSPSGKQFAITVDDSGVLTATEINV